MKEIAKTFIYYCLWFSNFGTGNNCLIEDLQENFGKAGTTLRGSYQWCSQMKRL
jgi:hypothetical protein